MEIPFNIYQFFLLFDLKRFAFLPNFFSIIKEMLKIEFVTSKAPNGFLRRGKTTFFLLNNSILVSAFLIGQILFILALLGKCCELHPYYKEYVPGCLMKRFRNIRKSMIYNGYLRFVSATMIKISVFSFLQLTDLNFSTTANIISSSFAIFGTAVAIFFPILIVKIMKNGHKIDEVEFEMKMKTEKFKRKFGGIY